MASLKEIRNRIASTSSTQQITKAMKLVSATKLRKAQGTIIQMRPYADKLYSMLANLSSSIEDVSLAKYFEHREVKKAMIIVVTSDRGLCGAFNTNIIKATVALINQRYADIPKNNIEILAIGKRGAEILRKMGYNVNETFKEILPTLDAAKAFDVAQFVLEQFQENKVDKVDIVYNKFKNAASQEVRRDSFLPVNIEDLQKGTSTNIDYIFEPSKVELLSDLIPRALKTTFYRDLADSLASEHGARMVAMEKATENAGDLIKSLKLTYNQARQASITKELSEIVGGAAAMEG